MAKPRYDLYIEILDTPLSYMEIKVESFLRKNSIPEPEISEFVKDIKLAKSYDHALEIIRKWVNVE